VQLLKVTFTFEFDDDDDDDDDDDSLPFSFPVPSLWGKILTKSSIVFTLLGLLVFMVPVKDVRVLVRNLFEASQPSLFPSFPVPQG
jgi:hypothetical protein